MISHSLEPGGFMSYSDFGYIVEAYLAQTPFSVEAKYLFLLNGLRKTFEKEKPVDRRD